ncbi:type IV secretory system conjugative DNA transfer family protein [Pseudoxanthomonas wuyuanensis]|uniref:Type IV secretion system protein VirD4 n=1 Tax=Pseudoxanthomonas wuyuanensis TaxID=1073196 RepID=A0A286DDS0_9GAMM|nr:type IV secretory system conjugative DNA transfer family protein [Pseudoxanthomonas wuyuanensis]KAF1716632.1 type VI secretion protein [Pseudoxanthomonas wuyuanensis]SOD56780.1 type IV secretion system protein VirD4 [Pseudoxanthomonas wuyuanensis]
MNSRLKFAFIVGGLLLALFAGLWLSGAMTLLLLGMSVPTKLTTFIEYWRAIDLPQVQPYATKIKVGGMVGFGIPLLTWAVSLFLFLKPKRKSIHGDARFANHGDLSKLGLLKDDPTGIIVGKTGGHFLRLPGTRHALLAAPTRSGKGVGAVIPNLLNFKGSMVVLDIKQEAFDITSGYRATLGDVFLFNPFAEDLRTHCWNPLAYVRHDGPYLTPDLQAIADCLYKESPGQDPFWNNQARACFVAAGRFLFDRLAWEVENGWPLKRTNPTLGGIYRLLSGDGGDLQEYLQRLMTQSGVSRDTKTAFANITSLAEQTFTSVIASAQAPLLIFLNPILDKATSSNDFWLPDLRRKAMSIYVGISPNKLSEASGILNLFFNQAIKLNTDQTPDKDPSLKHQCLYLLDEFTSLGRVDVMVDGVSYFAGYNVRVFCVIQSLSQLDAVYGADKARSMVTNLACQVVYTPREQRDANEYSEMLGFTTVRRRQRTRSHGQGGNVSYTEIEEKVELMKPQELKALSPEEEIVFIEGTPHPIKCSKIRYYKDRFFTSRLMEPVTVTTLEI